MGFYEKTAGRRSGNFSDSNSPCLKKLCSVKFPQFHDMLNESERYRVTANGLIMLLFRQAKLLCNLCCNLPVASRLAWPKLVEICLGFRCTSCVFVEKLLNEIFVVLLN